MGKYEPMGGMGNQAIKIDTEGEIQLKALNVRLIKRLPVSKSRKFDSHSFLSILKE